MAIPPGRWAGYVLLATGLLLLFDTYTFLQTNWAPLRVPLSPTTELIAGHLSIFLAVLLLVPTVVRALLGVLGDCVPDASTQAGECLSHPSMESRFRRRYPMSKKFSTLPNRGLVALAVLPILVPAFLMNFEQESRGIYIRLTPRVRGMEEYCMVVPIIVTVKKHKSSSKILLDGSEMNSAELESALKRKLAWRADWEVFVEGDDMLDLADTMDAIDVIHSLHGHAVILTPKLKKQLATQCVPR